MGHAERHRRAARLAANLPVPKVPTCPICGTPTVDSKGRLTACGRGYCPQFSARPPASWSRYRCDGCGAEKDVRVLQPPESGTIPCPECKQGHLVLVGGVDMGTGESVSVRPKVTVERDRRPPQRPRPVRQTKPSRCPHCHVGLIATAQTRRQFAGGRPTWEMKGRRFECPRCGWHTPTTWKKRPWQRARLSARLLQVPNGQRFATVVHPKPE